MTGPPTLAETRDQAIAFLEDIRTLTKLVERAETLPADLRQNSVILRRWIVEGNGAALQSVAAPRIGRVNIQAIDNNPVYRAERRGGLNSFVSGGCTIHGTLVAAAMMTEGPSPLNLDDYHPDKREQFSLTTFSKQKVIYSKGRWITRQEIIKFVANVDFGVHAGQAVADWELILADFKMNLCIDMRKVSDEDRPPGMPKNVKEIPEISWNVVQLTDSSEALLYRPSRVNGILIELLATMCFLVNSPDVQRLVHLIHEEVLV
jgi:hypothetical protein